jgi:Putative Ig domain
MVVAVMFYGLGIVPSTSAAAVPQTVDLRVLVIDDDTAWVEALQSQLTVEGIPFTSVPMSSPTRPTVNAAFLSSGDHAFYQAVIMSSYDGYGLSAAELTALRSFEATFGVREVDAYNWANPAVGLNYATFTGELPAGTIASVTDAGRANGFQYLNGPVTYSSGSYTFLATPLTPTSVPPIATGATFTTLLSAPISGSATPGSLIGVYSNAGVEQMIITSVMSFAQSHFKYLAHGIVSWATKGIHLGYNRNRMTFHVDDAFSDVALWDPVHNCTPGEDCPRNPDGSSIYPESSIRLTPDDITYATQWQAANNYTLTLAYNGLTAAADDPLTQSLVANMAAFKWLNHGLEHIYQGCVQDFTVSPWRCTTDGAGNIVWVSYDEIMNEINANIAVANTFGFPINPTEYLSGEHSGLYLTPQQPVDNPNFVAAVTASGLATIGADASREPAPRQVGSATTAPRHPTILYYNAATVAQEVDEYNWLYSTRANGGSGYCEDHPDVATCFPPMTAANWASTIVPNDAAFDLSFILSNDPRPFYAHTSNMGADRLIYPLLESILNTYRSTFNANAPLQNLTMTEVGTTFRQQGAWAAAGMSATPSVTASMTAGQITILNSGTTQVPLTAPVGTTVSGATLESYGGELSGWLGAAPSTTASVNGAPVLTIGAPNFVVGTAGTLAITASGQPAPTISMTGTLPAGLTFTPGSGSASIGGTPTVAGNYPISITATNSLGTDTKAVTLVVVRKPAFTSAATATATVGTAFTFNVVTTGTPTATLTVAGTLPAGVTFTPNANGTARLSGTPTVAGTSALTFTATNTAGATTQAFTLTINGAPRFTSAASATATAGVAFSFPIAATGTPAPTITRTGTLPSGVTFTAGANGTATLAGTPGATVSGTFPLTFTARNSAGTVTQSFVLTVNPRLTITSAASATFTVGTSSTFTVRATGSPAPTFTVTGTLPAGVTFVSGAGGTATLSGNPSAGTGGTYPLTIKATNAGGSVTQSFTLTVRQRPAFTSSASFSAAAGANVNFVITTTGFPAATVTRSGSLPTGLVWTQGANGTAQITGRSTARRTYNLTLTATNVAGSVSQNITIRIV